MELNPIPSQSFTLGPMHSLAVGPCKLTLRLDGEKVIDAKLEVGFLHRGLEKIAEVKPCLEFLPYASTLDYLSPLHSTLAFILAVEELSKIDSPERAQRIRVVLLELSRISNHLYFLGGLAKTVGLRSGFFLAQSDREKILNLIEMVTGARILHHYFRIGGVAEDITEGFIDRCYELLDSQRNRLKEYHALMTNNSTFQGRLIGKGKISQEQALSIGLTGPNLRASGVLYDVRKAEPYLSYSHYDFSFEETLNEQGVDFSIQGDSFRRFLLRMYEIETSMQIIQQALKHFPKGAHLKQINRHFKIPKGETYVAVESPRGLLGVYLSSNGGKMLERMHWRTPSFSILGLFPSLFQNVELTDVPIIMHSLDVLISEIDR